MPARPIRRNRLAHYRQGQSFGRPFRLNKNSPQANGLVGWWPTLGQGGDVLRNYARNGLDGALINAPTYTTVPALGIALDYERGSSQYTDLGRPMSLDISGQITISAWTTFE